MMGNANQSDGQTGERLLKSDEVADALGVSSKTVGIWTREGRIPSIRITRRAIRYRMSDVLRALEREDK